MRFPSLMCLAAIVAASGCGSATHDSHQGAWVGIGKSVTTTYDGKSSTVSTMYSTNNYSAGRVNPARLGRPGLSRCLCCRGTYKCEGRQCHGDFHNSRQLRYRIRMVQEGLQNEGCPRPESKFKGPRMGGRVVEGRSLENFRT